MHNSHGNLHGLKVNFISTLFIWHGRLHFNIGILVMKLPVFLCTLNSRLLEETDQVHAMLSMVCPSSTGAVICTVHQE